MIRLRTIESTHVVTNLIFDWSLLGADITKTFILGTSLTATRTVLVV